MDQPSPVQPSRTLLRGSFAVVLANLSPLSSLAAIFILAYLAVPTGAIYLLKMAHFVFDPAKATDAQFFTYEIVMNLAGSILLVPIWAGIYGVIFAILARDPNPSSGFSVAWKRYLPVVVLNLLTDVLSIAIDFGLRRAHIRDDTEIGSFIIYTLLTAPLMLSLPAMIGLKMGMFESVAYSLRRFEESPWRYFSYYFAATMVAISGLFMCGIGAMITIPAYVTAMALLVKPLEPAPATDL